MKKIGCGWTSLVQCWAFVPQIVPQIHSSLQIVPQINASLFLRKRRKRPKLWKLRISNSVPPLDQNPGDATEPKVIDVLHFNIGSVKSLKYRGRFFAIEVSWQLASDNMRLNTVARFKRNDLFALEMAL